MAGKKVFTSKEAWNDAVDKMTEELKAYVDGHTFLLWTDDICAIIDQNLGTMFEDAMRLYDTAKWLLVDSKDSD